MTTRQQNQRLSEIEGKPTFRIIDGVSIRFVESDPGDSDALLLSP
jgi:pimeloyl-ACP methyl ester carboxylesterase